MAMSDASQRSSNSGGAPSNCGMASVGASVSKHLSCWYTWMHAGDWISNGAPFLVKAVERSSYISISRYKLAKIVAKA